MWGTTAAGWFCQDGPGWGCNLRAGARDYYGSQYIGAASRGDIAERARELTRQICGAREVTIVRGAISPDHVHMLVSAPPQLAPAKLVQFIKGRSSRMLPQEFPALRKRYWGQHLWARGYFCASVGAVDEKTSRE